MPPEIKSDGVKVVGTRPIRPDGVEKVTGHANFGADRAMRGMLYGKIKRSPHAHARILRINTERALALPGVRAVATAADFPEIAPEEASVGEGPMNFRDLSRNVMARNKALYEGPAVAAVAAVLPSIAAEALELIELDYEILPHVIDVQEAMAEDAPLLHDDLFTQGLDPKPEKPSNIAKRAPARPADGPA
jgi:CO/xanthine dehydrogenase Mo-binding subunit